MSEHHFGVGRGKISPRLGKQVDKIAKEAGAEFTWVTLPGDGPRYWFSCDNLGFPFDQSTERAVYAALRKAGLYDRLFPPEA